MKLKKIFLLFIIFINIFLFSFKKKDFYKKKSYNKIKILNKNYKKIYIKKKHTHLFLMLPFMILISMISTGPIFYEKY